MPELPEVETMVRGLESKINEGEIERVEVIDQKLLRNTDQRKFQQTMTGNKIRDISRKGKYLLLDLKKGGVLAIHPRMTGRFVVNSYPAETDYARLKIILGDEGTLVFDDMRRFGTLDLLPDEDSGPLKKLGLDPLSPDYKEENLARVLQSRSEIKRILLDQKKIAGIGNIYASEILFRATISPWKKGSDLEKGKIKKLFKAIPEVLQEAIEKEGTTISDFRNPEGDSGNFQLSLRVYGKEGEECPRCSGEVQKAKQGGRGTYFCPSCQGVKEEK